MLLHQRTPHSEGLVRDRHLGRQTMTKHEKRKDDLPRRLGKGQPPHHHTRGRVLPPLLRKRRWRQHNAEEGSSSDGGLRDNRTARQAIGYRQVLEHLDGGPGLAETVELVKARTRQFAKRQRTWFRNQMNCQPFECLAGESGEACCERLLGMLG